MTHTQTTYINRIALRAGKNGRVLLRLEPCSKNQLQSSNNKKLLKFKQTKIASFNV